MVFDAFFNMKSVTRDDVLAAHRIAPQLMDIVPGNSGGFGAADEAAEAYELNEIAPPQRRFEQFNEWIGEDVVRFAPYTIGVPANAATRARPA